MKNLLFISLAIALTLGIASCSKGEKTKLSQSVFVPDPKYPDLPKYSDWGYNTFGAHIDRIKFVSGEELPIKITVKDDTCRMVFNGIHKTRRIKLSFTFPKSVFPKNSVPKNKFDLLELNEKNFDFKKTDCILSLGRYETDTLKIIKGGMEFKSVKKLYVDKELSKTILSGEFDFQAYLRGEPISILNGRFDFGIDDSNFYILE